MITANMQQVVHEYHIKKHDNMTESLCGTYIFMQ